MAARHHNLSEGIKYLHLFRIRHTTPAINQREDTTKLFRDLCEAVLLQCKGSKILCDGTSAGELDRGTILM